MAAEGRKHNVAEKKETADGLSFISSQPLVNKLLHKMLRNAMALCCYCLVLFEIYLRLIPG